VLLPDCIPALSALNLPCNAELPQYSGIAEFVEPVWWRTGAVNGRMQTFEHRQLSPPLSGCAELLQYSGIADFVEPVWWRVGAAKAAGEDLNYLGVAGLRIAGGYGIIIIAVCQVLPTTAIDT